MMECNIYDLNLNRIGVLYTWVSMVWEESYNADGAFQLEVQQNEATSSLLKSDVYAGIPESDTLMLIKAVQVSDGTIVATGYPATVLFSDRVSTDVISNQNAESALRGLVQKMEQWPCVELGDSYGVSDAFTAEKSDASLLEYMQIISQAVDMGFRLRHERKNKKLLFECYKPGVNENARYSTKYGNMGSLEYSASTASLKNVAVVAGSGEGDSRVTVVAGDTGKTGSERREMYVDARNVQKEEGESDSEYQARLVRYGEEKLVGQVRIENFSFVMSDDRAALGDLVTANVPEIGIKLQVRITGVRLTSQDNMTTVEAILGNPIILRRW